MSAASLPSPFSGNLKVLVLAGSDPVSRRRRQARESRSTRGEREVPLEDKAFRELRGKLVIEHVLDWLAACGLEDIWVLARQKWLSRIPDRHRFRALVQPPGSTVFVNLSAAYAEIAPSPEEPVLIVFGDHPFNTRAALHAFLRRCGERLEHADCFHAVALRQAYAQFAPWFRRTSVHLRELSWRASGLTLAIPSRLHRLKALDEMYAVRKLEQFNSFVSLLGRLVVLLGPRSPQALFDAVRVYLAKEMEKRARGEGARARWAGRAERWLARQVPARRIEQHVARVLAAERGVELIALPHGGIALDVDFAEELELMDREWEAIHDVVRSQDADLDSGKARVEQPDPLRRVG